MNPAIQEALMRRSSQNPAQAGGGSMKQGGMMGPAMQQMQQSQPGEATLIIKALINRLRQNPVAGAPAAA